MRTRKAWMATAIGVGMICASAVALASTDEKVGVIGASNPATSSQGKEGGTQRTLQVGNDVYFEDMITTDAKGNAQVMFLDRSSLTVGPNSSLKIDKFVYDPATSAGELTIKGTKGVFRFVGGALSKKNPVKIKTPVATIGIRGGIVLVDVAANGATTSTMVFGNEMTMENQNGQISRTTQPGMAIDVRTPNTPPSQPYQVNIAQLQQRVQTLSPLRGTSGGAQQVPTSDDIQQSSVSTSITQDGEAAPPPPSAPNQGGEGNAPAPGTAPDGNTNQDGNGEIKLNEAPDDGGTQQASTSGSGSESGSGGSVISNQVTTTQTTSTPPAPNQVVTNNSQVTREVSTNADVIANTNQVSRSDPQTVINKATELGVPVTNQPAPPVYQFSGRYMEVEIGVTNNPGEPSEEGIFRSYLNNGGLMIAEITQTAPLFEISTETLPGFIAPGLHTYGNILTVAGGYHYSYNYISPRGHMFFYHDLDYNPNVTTNGIVGIESQINAVGGRTLPVSQLPTTGIQAFHVLPQLELDYFNPDMLNTLAAYYAPNSLVLPANSNNHLQPQPKFYVNWANNAVLGGVITEQGMGTVSGGTYDGIADTVAFIGRINRGTPNQPINGFFMDFATDTSYPNPSDDAITAGTGGGRVLGKNLYGTPGQFDGMLLEVMNGGERESLPIVAASTTTQPSVSQPVRNTQGFAAGFIVTDLDTNGHATASTEMLMYSSKNLEDVHISESTTQGLAGARISMREDGTSNYMHAWFGEDDSHGVTGAPKRASASIKPGIYGAQQNMVRFSPQADPTNTTGVSYPDNYTNNINGAVLSGHFAEGVTCTRCQFVDWGVWSGNFKQPGNTVDAANMVYYVNGEPTNLSQLPAMGTGPTAAAYSGIALGSLANATTGQITQHHNGTMNATVDFQNRNISSLSVNIPSMGLAVSSVGSMSFSTGPKAVFNGQMSGTLNGNSVSGSGGFANGALFGPKGQGIGGNFTVQNMTPGDRAAGVFLGGCNAGHCLP